MLRIVVSVAVVTLLCATLPAQLTAVVTTVGTGCPVMPSYPATLTVQQAVIGNQSVVNPAGLPAGDGVLWASLGPPAQPTLLYPGCFAYLDLNTFQPLASFVTGTAGIGWIVFNVPNDPALVGVDLTMQAAISATWQAPGQLPLVTDAVYVVIGDQY